MARQKNPGRVEPRFGRAGDDAPAIASDDRRGRGVKPVRDKADKPASRRKLRQEAGTDRPRRSLLNRFVCRSVYWSFILCLWAGIAVAGLVAFYAMQLPGASEWKVPDRPPNVQIVAVDGALIGNRGDTGGESVRIEQLPGYVPNAVIAIEDRRYRSHFGIDPIGLVRAVAKNYTAGGVVEGGSTLTQQLAKNMFLSPERSLKRKVQEVVLAVWLETKFSKDQILEMYLNRVYFGAGAYGVDAAARRYFDREASELTLPQAAMLAGLLPAPSAYAPNKNPEAARARAELVLAAMADQGFITADDLALARDKPAQAASLHMTRSENYVADWVMAVLPFHLASVERDVVVETTVDLQLQKEAERAVAETLDSEGKKFGASEAALVAVDGTGAVRAMVGGRSYSKSQFNRAVDAKRQPGSTFKPFVYLTAIEQLGLRPDTVRVDQPVTFGNWSPKNSHDDFRGPVTLTTALASSINTIAAQLAYEVGPKGRGGDSAAHGDQLATGAQSVHCVGNVRSIFAGDHRRLRSLFQRRLCRDASCDPANPHAQRGRSVRTHRLRPRPVASAESVAMMNSMLQAAVESGTATKAAIAGWQVAGKTGTSQDYRDAWFLGYTANLSAGVWVGNDSNASMKRVFGGTLPAAIWQAFMTKAHAGVPVAQLPGSDLMPYLAAASVGAGASRVVAQAGETRRARAVQARARPQRVRRERRGFFRRLFNR
jgi:penicillin-binding protein 1A